MHLLPCRRGCRSAARQRAAHAAQELADQSLRRITAAQDQYRSRSPATRLTARRSFHAQYAMRLPHMIAASRRGCRTSARHRHLQEEDKDGCRDGWVETASPMRLRSVRPRNTRYPGRARTYKDNEIYHDDPTDRRRRDIRVERRRLEAEAERDANNHANTQANASCMIASSVLRGNPVQTNLTTAPAHRVPRPRRTAAVDRTRSGGGPP